MCSGVTEDGRSSRPPVTVTLSCPTTDAAPELRTRLRVSVVKQTQRPKKNGGDARIGVAAGVLGLRPS